MIHIWYSKFKRMRLFKAFLKHRIWAARMVISYHILYCFPLASLALVWLFFPIVVLTLLSIALFPGSDIFLPALVLLLLLFFIAIGPIFTRTLTDLFRGYLAGLFAVFGQKMAAQAFLRDAREELEEWEHQNA